MMKTVRATPAAAGHGPRMSDQLGGSISSEHTQTPAGKQEVPASADPAPAKPGHYFRPDICVNGKHAVKQVNGRTAAKQACEKPVTQQAREHNSSFAQDMTLAEFSQRGNALSASVLRWPRGFVFSRGKFFEAFNDKARFLGFYLTELAAAKAVLKASRGRT
jgi:hypothetical protein